MAVTTIQLQKRGSAEARQDPPPPQAGTKQAAQSLIKNGQYDQGTLNTVEMAIRAYDPCLSCATHRMDGRLPVELRIVGPDGKLLETVTN